MQLRASGGRGPAFDRHAFSLRLLAGIEAAIGAGSLPKVNAMSESRTDQIRKQNDNFRTTLNGGGQCVFTAGISALGIPFTVEAMVAIRNFQDFNADNDPYGEHDFGSFRLGDQTVFWKIDYYDLSLNFGSKDPADAAQTKRVLTIMLAEEY